MSRHTPTIFLKSCVAVAVISLTACTTTPRNQDPDYRDGSSILSQAGEKTRAAGSLAWEGTRNLLGLNTDSHSNDELLDEVDLALMEEDAVFPAEADRPIEENLPDSQAQVSAQVAVSNEPATASVAGKGIVHEVQSNETLWDIAKATTGDANNWHVLADINNLEQNASVFPGQQLSIPADLVKPELIETASNDSLEQSEPLSDISAVEEAAPIVIVAEAETVEKESQLPGSEIVADQQPIESETRVASVMTEAQPFKLNKGESLWDFAKRTTGDATNWTVIAEHNDFSEKEAVLVFAGQTIFVPADIIKVADDSSSQLSDTADKSSLKLATNKEIASALPADEKSVELPAASLADSVAIKQPSGQLLKTATNFTEKQLVTSKKLMGRQEQDDSTKPLNFVDTNLEDLKAELNSQLALSKEQMAIEATHQLEEEKIMVGGTYYPKAVYNAADFSSSLLMRVSPGTELAVYRAVGPWFEVQTAKGLGYVHSRDIK